MPNPLEYTIDGVEVVFTNTSTNGVYAWDFGDTQTSIEAAPTHTYTYDFLSTTPLLTVALSTTVDGCTDVQEVTVDAIFTVSVEEVEATMDVFPNPAGNALTIRTTHVAQEFQVLDASGRVVYSVKNPGTGNIHVPLETLVPGAYTIQLRMATNTISKRFIKF
jgi:hypothetical protein